MKERILAKIKKELDTNRAIRERKADDRNFDDVVYYDGAIFALEFLYGWIERETE